MVSNFSRLDSTTTATATATAATTTTSTALLCFGYLRINTGNHEDWYIIQESSLVIYVYMVTIQKYPILCV